MLEFVIVVEPVIDSKAGVTSSARVGEYKSYGVAPTVELISKTCESEITNGPKLVVVEIFPALSTEATWNHKVPEVAVEVVVEVVKNTPGVVELVIVVASELSQRVR